jgi:hypothetical protein
MARRESKIGFAAVLAVEEEGAPAVMPEIAQRHLGDTKSKSQTEQRLELFFFVGQRPRPGNLQPLLHPVQVLGLIF